MVRLEDFSKIGIISMEEGERENVWPGKQLTRKDLDQASALVAYQQSFRLYKDFLLPELEEAGIVIANMQKVRIIGGGVGGALDALALMEALGGKKLEVEVVESSSKSVVAARRLKQQLEGVSAEFRENLGHISIVQADARTLPEITSEGKSRTLNPVSLSVIRSISYANARDLMQAMVRSTNPGGVVFATVADFRDVSFSAISNSTEEDKHFSEELGQLDTIVGELVASQRVRMLGKRISITNPMHRINGGGIFTGDRAMIVLQVTPQQVK